MTVEKDARRLSVDDLGITVTADVTAVRGGLAAPSTSDPRLQEIIKLRERYGGVVLSGPPGTSKSWYAKQAAKLLTGGDDNRVEFVQFHASYQFEDFMEGFRPRLDGTGFERRSGVFLKIAESAYEDSENLYVLVIDELSRADVGRVFGEALTYVDASKRGENFTLPSGKKRCVPENVWIIATMNPIDRGVDGVDAAFGRRFARIELGPDEEVLREKLTVNGMDADLVGRLVEWFVKLKERAQTVPAAGIGHAFFWSAATAADLKDVWQYQLRYVVDRAFKYDRTSRDEVAGEWSYVIEGPSAAPTGASGTTPQP